MEQRYDSRYATGYGIVAVWDEEEGRWMNTLLTATRLNELTAERDALAAAARKMVEQCPVCGGEGDGTWIVQGKSFPCPYCHATRAALALVQDTAGKEE